MLDASDNALEEVSGSMFVAGGFRAIECVLDHGPPEQGRGQRVLSLDQLRRRIQQEVEISVDLRGTRQHQLGGAGLVRPPSEKVAAPPEKLLKPRACLMARSSASTSSKSGSFFR